MYLPEGTLVPWRITPLLILQTLGLGPIPSTCDPKLTSDGFGAGELKPTSDGIKAGFLGSISEGANADPSLSPNSFRLLGFEGLGATGALRVREPVFVARENLTTEIGVLAGAVAVWV